MNGFHRVNTAALVLCFVVVVFGAFVRLSNAGLGCPDWPGCYGHIAVPDAPHELAKAERNYPQRPVEAPKAWKEMIHRYLAGTVGTLILILAVLAARDRSGRAPRRLAFATVGVVLVQIVFGALTVTMKVNPIIVTTHLLLGLTTLALVWLMWLRGAVRQWEQRRAGGGIGQRGDGVAGATAAAVATGVVAASTVTVVAERVSAAGAASVAESVSASTVRVSAAPIRSPRAAGTAPPPPRVRFLAGIALVVLAIQIFLGGWTSTNYAAVACPDFPTCQGSFWPRADFASGFTLWHGAGINYEYGILDSAGRTAIHLTHRYGAAVVALTLGSIAVFLLLRGASGLWRRLGVALLLALVLQLSIGIGIIELHFPLWLADAHNAGAAVLLLTVLAFNFFAWRDPGRPSFER
jgi:cytochrome c oxidase assembly protein subunit 15